jgi:hypothetical protein
MTVPDVSFGADFSDIDVGVVALAYKVPSVKGKAKGTATLTLAGKTPEEMTNSLKAQMKAEVLGGSLEGTSLLKLGLDAIPIPGLGNMLLTALPQETRLDMDRGVTVVESCTATAHMNGMTATIDKAELVTRDIVIQAKGTAKIVDTLDLKVDFFVMPTLADSLVRSVSDLAALFQDDGRMYIPVTVSGPFMKPQVSPDTAYLTKKLLVNRGQKELQKVIGDNPEVSGVLNAIFGGNTSANTSTEGSETTSANKTESGSASEVPGTQKETSTSQAVDAILNTLFKK